MIDTRKKPLFTKKAKKKLLENRMLRDELSVTNQGLIALTMEIEEKNEEVQALTEQLWQVARMATMGELAASIAHDLNNPLATMALRLESLMSQIPADDPKQRSLQIISREIDRMAALVKKLLDFSRHGQNQLTKVDICREVDYALDLITYHVHKQGIRVIKDYSPELPWLFADRRGLHQLFLNLFINASDAMPEGGELTIRIYKSSVDDIAIDIIDTGMGIPPDVLAHVMDPFLLLNPRVRAPDWDSLYAAALWSITAEQSQLPAPLIKAPLLTSNFP